MTARFLSTQQVAERCGVSTRTVCRWVDAGVLPAVFTTGGHRRIAVQDLNEFLASRRSLIARGRETPVRRLLAITADSDLLRTLRGAVGVRLTAASDAFEAGLLLYEDTRQVVLVDAAPSPDQARAITRALARRTATLGTRVGVVGPGDFPSADVVLERPVSVREVLRLFDDALDE